MAQLMLLRITEVQNFKEPMKPWVVQFQAEHMEEPEVWYYQTPQEAQRDADKLMFMAPLVHE